MKFITSLLPAMALFVTVVATPAFGQDVTHSTPGINGYDPVAYFTEVTVKRDKGIQHIHDNDSHVGMPKDPKACYFIRI